MNAERLEVDRNSARCASVVMPLDTKGGVVASSTVPSGNSKVDLRSASSGAAIELDNIRLRRKTKTVAIQRLAELLAAGAPTQENRNSPMSLITPTVVVMDRVVRSSKPNARIEDVIEGLDKFLANLRMVATEPITVRETEPGIIEELQTTCLDISRFAASLRRPAAPTTRTPRRS